jgi:subtilisin family serine protease
LITFLFAVLLVLLAVPAAFAKAPDNVIPGRYIVVFKNSVQHPGAVAESQATNQDADLGYIYRNGLKGYAAKLSKGAVETLNQDPRVKYVTPDVMGELASQEIPTGIARSYVSSYPGTDIDEVDDVRVNADVAVIDSGVDASHPDLNVVERTDCVTSVCIDGQGADLFGHGTHVGGIIGALDNGIGVVGVAPGARLWSVRVSETSSVPLSATIAGVNWVTAHASQIEAANMSLLFMGYQTPLAEAISKSVQAGVVYVVAAGNADENAGNSSPAAFGDVITVSALSDYDGIPGGLGSQTCSSGGTNFGKDDRLAGFSNWGNVVDIAAPGSCIKSTWPGGGYQVESGTSMASPHVAGAAALLASENNPNSQQDVEAIRSKLINEGSLNWVEDSGDGAKEPLLDLRPPAREAVTLPATGLQTNSVRLNGIANGGGLAGNYYFEYGTSAAYGSKAPGTAKSIEVGTKDVEVGETIAVQPETTYHFRIVVSNGQGTSYGADQTLKTSPWSAQITPDPNPEEGDTGRLRGVSCASSTSCLAVGVFNKAGSSFSAFAEVWDGSSWTVAPLPLFPGQSSSGSSQLNGVSCVSSTSCMAVGWYETASEGRKALTVSWNGSAWSFISSSKPSGAVGPILLNGVSCPSANSCTAVGNYLSQTGVPSKQETRTLVQAWNGTEWTIKASANPEGQKQNMLSGVACVSATSCTAVGRTGQTIGWGSGTKTLAEAWNGSTWSLQTVPAPAGVTQSALEDISCSSATSCLAVGNTNNPETGSSLQNGPVGFALNWDGAQWSVSTSLQPGPFFGVSCGAVSSCDAIGDGVGRHWDGGQWTIEDTFHPLDGSDLEIGDVSCASKTACTAVGSFSGPRYNHGTHVLAERLTPRWSLQSTPTPPTVTESALEDVSCTSTTACWGVGVDNRGGSTIASAANGLIEQWNGTSWQQLARDASGPLYGSTCAPATTFCVAVGQRANGNGTLVEHVSGSKWSLQSTPDPATADEIKLEDVSCTSASECTAVGHYHSTASGTYKPLALRWNGTAWSLQTTPDPDAEEGKNAELLSVSCSSSTFCIAIGKFEKKVSGTSFYERAFAERWNGSTWTPAAPPSFPGQVNSDTSRLIDVSCSSSTSCMAVGWYTVSGEGRKALTVGWDGSAWNFVFSPRPSGAVENGTVQLSGISCVSPTACTAVGKYLSVGGLPSKEETRTLTQAWNGSEWFIQPSQNPEGQKRNELSGVSCVSSVLCTALGRTQQTSTSGIKTLAEGYE